MIVSLQAFAKVTARPVLKETAMLTDVFVPLLTYPDATSAAGVEEALLITQKFASSATACAVEIDIPDLSNRLSLDLVNVAGMAAAAEARSHAFGVELLERFKQHAGGLKAESDTIKCRLDQVGELLCSRARTHDLTVMLLDPHSSYKRMLVEALIFGAGRPVLVVPENFKHRSADHLAVAWDGSRAASRAVHDAMPLIEAGQSVSLITAFDDKAIGAGAVADLVAYLERHNVKSSHHDIGVAGKSIGPALQEAALSQGAGILVMGAFGHSRLRDFVLGGATRTTLEDCRLPVLFSH
jgi:nucleotide-binding universal stress UspA family protein